jgi:hypothetical protein
MEGSHYAGPGHARIRWCGKHATKSQGNRPYKKDLWSHHGLQGVGITPVPLGVTGSVPRLCAIKAIVGK